MRWFKFFAYSFFELLILLKRVGNDLRLGFKLDEYAKSIARDGYVVLEAFVDDKQCQLMRKDIDDALVEYQADIYVDDECSDHRVFGVDIYGDAIPDFSSSSFLLGLANNYSRCESSLVTTLAGLLKHSGGNKGSGGGWHKDSVSRQFKAILYLTDVAAENGPFQYLKYSHKFLYRLVDGFKASFGISQTRIDGFQVESILKGNESRLISVTGKAGDLVLVDTSGIHRGKPIESGERYALTNYYYRAVDVTDDLINHFQPSIKSIENKRQDARSKKQS